MAIYCKNKEKSGPKAPYKFYFGQTRKPIIVMVFDFLDVSTTPNTNYFQTIQNMQTKFKKLTNSILETWKSIISENGEKTRPKQPEDPCDIFSEIWNM